MYAAKTNKGPIRMLEQVDGAALPSAARSCWQDANMSITQPLTPPACPFNILI